MKYNVENRSGLYVNGVAYPSGLWSGGGYTIEYVDPVVNITRFPYDEIDTVIYDDSNIFIEFNELVGTSTDSNVLVATDYDGYGVAKAIGESLSSERSNPIMTSATAPKGVVTTNKQLNNNYAAWKAFDGVMPGYDYNRWVSTNNSGWIQYEYETEVAIGEYDIQQDGYSQPQYSMNTWTLKASNTGSFTGEEIMLDSQSGMTWVSGQTRKFTLTNRTKYKYYRIDCTSANGTYCAIGEWVMYTIEGDGTEYVGLSNISAEFEFSNISDAPSTADTLVTSSLVQDGDNLVIVKDDDSIHELVASGVTPSVPYTPPPNLSFQLGSLTHWSPSSSRYAVYQANDDGRLFINSVSPDATVTCDYNNIPVIVGTRYKFSCRYTANHTHHYAHFYRPRIIDANGTALTAYWHKSTRFGWTYYEEEFVATTNTIRIDVAIRKMYGWYNDFNIERVDDHTIVDTTAVTQGEIPSKAYAVDAKTSFAISGGYVDAVTLSDDYSYISNSLFTTRNYGNLIDSLSSTTINPKVTLKSTGDKMNRMKFTTLKENT